LQIVQKMMEKKVLSDVGETCVMAKLESIKNMCHTHIKNLLTVAHTNAPPNRVYFSSVRVILFMPSHSTEALSQYKLRVTMMV